MTSAHCFIAVLAVAAFPLQVIAGVDAPLQAKVEGAAKEITWLDLGSVLFDRDPLQNPPDAAANLSRLRGLLQMNVTSDDVLPLLSHDDPKVRTLGIVLVYHLCDISLIGHVVSLAIDTDVTFPQPAQMLGRRLGEPPPDPWPMQQRRVGDWAQAVARAYLSAAGVGPGTVGGASSPEMGLRIEWEHFWAMRKDKRVGAAEYVIRLQIAGGGISPMQPERIRRVQRLSALVHELPMPERFFVFLRMHGGAESDQLITRDLLLALARRVPRDVRLAVLRNERPPGFADLDPGFGSTYFLTHAAHLFTPDDARVLLDEGNKRLSTTRPSDYSPNVHLFTAAAELRPADAERVVLDVFPRFWGEFNGDNRLILAQCLFRHAGTRQLDYLVSWFYTEPVSPGSFPGTRAQFLSACREIDPHQFRALAAAIVLDERFGGLGPPSVREILWSVEGWLGRTLADEEQIRQSQGIDESQRDRPFALLDEWKRLIRETVDEWGPTRATTLPTR